MDFFGLGWDMCLFIFFTFVHILLLAFFVKINNNFKQNIDEHIQNN
jgi:hypothetical protein